MLQLALALVSPALAAPSLGLDYVPFGRADLVWVDEDQSTGTRVGEFDGLIRPSLTPYLLLPTDRVSWVLGMGFARSAQTSWTGEQRRKVTQTGIRPAVDAQVYVKPNVWVGAGLYGVIPIVRDVSTAYGEAEQTEADETSRQVMARIGGVGSRVGAGAEFELTEGVHLGLRTHVNGWRGQRITEESVDISTLTWVDAGLRLQVEFGS